MIIHIAYGERRNVLIQYLRSNIGIKYLLFSTVVLSIYYFNNIIYRLSAHSYHLKNHLFIGDDNIFLSLKLRTFNEKYIYES